MHSKAFSMYELLIVIFIMGVVAAISIVFFGRSEPVIHLNSAADMLVADMSLARQRAISRYDNTISWEINFDTSNNRYTIRARDAGNNVIAAHTQVKELPPEIEFRYVSGDFKSGITWPQELTSASVTVNSAVNFGGQSSLRFLSSGRAVGGASTDFGVGYLVMRNQRGNVKLLVVTGMTGRIKVYTLFTDGTDFE